VREATDPASQLSKEVAPRFTPPRPAPPAAALPQRSATLSARPATRRRPSGIEAL